MFSVINFLEQIDAATEEKEAFIEDDNAITFRELRYEVTKLSNVLLDLGMKKGDRIGIYMNKSLDKIQIILASLYSNLIFVPILPNLKHDNIKHIINDSGMKYIVTDSTKYDELIKFKPFVKIINGGVNEIKGVQSIKILKSNIYNPINPFNSISTDTASIIYSSGSTGRPKGIIVSHKNLHDGAKIVSNYLETKQEDKILGILSFNFDYGLNQIWQTLYKKASLYLYNMLLPNDLLHFIESKKITAIPLMPVIINRIFDSKFLNRNISYDMSSVKYVCTSGGKVSQKMIENLDATFNNSKIYLMYGLTEAFRSSYLIPEQLYVRPNSIGKAIPDVELYILNEKGNDCKPGEIGELVHRGGCISKGYWNDEINTRHRFRTIDRFPGEKVVFSGDYVKKDEDGFIYFISRKDNMLKNSGIRISPTEIEQTFEKNDKVISTVVFGIENIKVGHDIVLAYTSIDRKSIEIKELRKFAKKHLPFHMVPKYFFHFEEFPVTGNQGKIDRVTVVKSLEKKIL